MIPKISVSDQNRQTASAQPNFKGGPIDLAVAGLQACEANPMVNVSVADLSTAIVPRTVIEGQTNPYAGLEAFRRESSGLVINCLIPGVIVAGAAKLLSHSIMGGDTKMSKCWANEDAINLVCKYWQNAEGSSSEEKVRSTITNILRDTKGIDGYQKEHIEFEKFLDEGKFDKSIDELVAEVFSTKTKPTMLTKAWFADRKATKEAKAAAKNAGEEYFESPISRIISHTRSGENIKIFSAEELKAAGNDIEKIKEVDKLFGQSLNDVLGNTPKILKELIAKQAANPEKSVEEITKDFAERAGKLVSRKSLLGLGIIIPLAIMAQPINRWITEKTSGKKGAPIYKDFTEAKVKEQTPKEKAELAKQKLISVGSMIGVALLSIMKKPDKAMWKSVTQFKGIFPTMDQARIISTATFASRMMASEDKNDLREATFRDIATFSAFYFLGDYVSKGFASAIQYVKKDVNLINDLKPLKEGETRNILKKMWHWTKNTALKSSDELQVRTATGKIDEAATKYAQRLRSFCQLGNLGFSLIALGLVIPNMYRKKTAQEHEKELKAKATEQKSVK